MKCVLSLLVVIATPTLGQYRSSNFGGYGDGFRSQYPIDPSGIGGHPYGPQIDNSIPGADRRSRGPGGYLDDSQYGFFGPDFNNRIPNVIDLIGGSHRSPSRGQRRRDRHESSEDNSITEYDSSMDSGRQHPRRFNYKDDHFTGWDGSAENPLIGGRGGRRPNGRRRPRPNDRRPPRRGRRESSEESSASASSSEEDTRRRGNRGRRNGRNRNVGADLGQGVIPYPGDLGNMGEILERAFGAGRDFLDESRNQLDKMGKRVSDSVMKNGQQIGETLRNGVDNARTQAENNVNSVRNGIQEAAGKIPGTLGQNGTALTLGSFRDQNFVKQFLENIYNAMKSWGQVLKGLPKNIWSRFENMINCMKGSNCPE